METKIYRKIDPNPDNRNKIRKVTLSAQMADIPDTSIYGIPYIVKVYYRGYIDNNLLCKDYIIFSDSFGNAIQAFFNENEKILVIAPHLIEEIVAIKTDIIVDITQRIGM